MQDEHSAPPDGLIVVGNMSPALSPTGAQPGVHCRGYRRRASRNVVRGGDLNPLWPGESPRTPGPGRLKACRVAYAPSPQKWGPSYNTPFGPTRSGQSRCSFVCGELLELRHGAPGYRTQALLRHPPFGFRFGKCGRGYLRFALWAGWAAPPRRDAAFAFARLPRFVRAAQSLGNGRHTRHGAARFRPQSRADRKVRCPEESQARRTVCRLPFPCGSRGLLPSRP